MPNVWVSEEPLSTYELIERLEELTTSPSYYFLRWAHRVGGFGSDEVTSLPTWKMIYAIA